MNKNSDKLPSSVSQMKGKKKTKGIRANRGKKQGKMRLLSLPAFACLLGEGAKKGSVQSQLDRQTGILSISTAVEKTVVGRTKVRTRIIPRCVRARECSKDSFPPLHFFFESTMA